MSIFGCVLFIILLLLWKAVWLLVGMMLLQTRTLAVCSVHKFWFRVWRGYTAKVEVIDDVDLRVLNQCLLATFLLESIPHVVIQVRNNSLNNSWTGLEAVSVISSLYMLASGVWRFLYYWLWRGEPLAGVPLKNPAESVWRHEFETRTSPNGV